MKRQSPAPLGVLEFTSALNGEDPHTILQKLRHFVHVARHQRRLALGAIDVDGSNDVMEEDDNDEGSICSLFQEGVSSKRRRLNDKNDKTPAWQMDKNDYRVPFVGTSVAKGDVGSVVVGSWPTGFLEVYQKHSPKGVELLRNDYISALPPNGIHRTLCKGVSFDTETVKKRKSSTESEPTHGHIISLSLQNYYWMALSEWVMGFVPMDVLKRDLQSELGSSSSPELSIMIPERNTKGGKCAIPPEMMTILMKQRMPEWIDTIQNYMHQQHQQNQQLMKTKQQHKQQRKKQDRLSKEEQQIQSKLQQQQTEKLKEQQTKWEKRQRRDGVLLTSALRNLRTMCLVSIGTAREVLRRLSLPGTSSKASDGHKPRGKVGGKGGPDDGGIAWMAQVLQQNHASMENTSTSDYCNPHVECLRLTCTLLESKDYAILSRLCQAPAWSAKQGKGSKDCKSDHLGLLYIALRYGTQYLLDGYTSDVQAMNDETNSFAKGLCRLLKDVRITLLPNKEDDYSDATNQRSEGFILGPGATADLLSGDVLVNITKLSLLAPILDSNASFVSGILHGKDSYEDLSFVEDAAVEARRLLFVLLADAERSPFLTIIRFKDRAEQFEAHFNQLSKALHSLLLYRGNNQLMRVFLRTCLSTTPRLVPHVFRSLYLPDSKPNYRTLSSLSFIDGVVSGAPSAQVVLFSQQSNQNASTNITRDYIVPTCVSKLLIGKVIQSSSALLVSSGVKLIATILHRANDFISRLSNSGRDQSEKKSGSIRQEVFQHLPHISLLLSIPTRFDPFEENASQANAIVVMELCKAIQCYGQLDPSLLENIQFDWAKMLPLNSDKDEPLRSYAYAEPCCMVAILQLLIFVSRFDGLSSKLLTSVLLILTSTKIFEVYKTARELALSLIEKELFSNTCGKKRDNETISCNKYECSLWVDEMDTDSISEFVTWIVELQQHRVPHKLFVSQAWAVSGVEYDMPPLCTSMLSSLLISKLLTNESCLSPVFSRLVAQVATKLLIFQNNPKPLASVVVHAADMNAHLDEQYCNLRQFAKTILRNDKQELVPVTLKMDMQHYTTSSVALRQCLSFMRYQSGSYDNSSALLRGIMPHVFEDHDIADITPLIVSAFESKILRPIDMKCISTFLFAALDSDCSKAPSLLALEGQSSIELELTCAILQLSAHPSHLSQILNDILKHAVTTIQHGNSTLRDFLLQILLGITENEMTANFPPDAVFHLWTSLSGHLDTTLAAKLYLRIEDYLSYLFDTCDEQRQWIVYQNIINDPGLFVERCLRATEKYALQNNVEAATAGRFLSSVLTYDCSEFTCLAKLLSDIDQDSELIDSWNTRQLDLIAYTFITQTQNQFCKEITKSPLYGRALAGIGKRLTYLLKQEDPGTITTQANLRLLHTLSRIGSMPQDLPSKLLEVIGALQDGSRTESVNDQIHLVELVVCICQGRNDSHLLLAHAFVRCCKVLPKVLKSFLRTKQPEASSLFLRMTSMISQLLERWPDFDQDTLSSYSSSVEKLIVACLKYGIADADSTDVCLVNGECLKTVRTILKASNQNSSSIVGVTLGQIHSMVVSHSSFQRVMSKKAYDDLEAADTITQQTELIQLLFLCVSLDSPNVKVDNITMATILSAYNASTSCADIMIRRLIYHYSANACFEEEMLMSSFRWGSAARRNTDKGEGWDWLLDAIDGDRIRATLMQYPVSDSLEPDLETLTGEDATSNSNEQPGEYDEASLSNEEGRISSDDESRTSISIRSPNKKYCSTKTTGDQWLGQGEDVRYSPGFILPLVLGALEEHLSIEHDVARDQSSEKQEANEISDESAEVKEQHQAYCHFSKRLCDRGIIALSLASLSSRCPSIRKVAVAICGLFLKALQMEEAQTIKSWHERPQLEMVMTSVQRGLALRRAIQIQKAKESQNHRVINVPMLPAVSAVFLAKSLMIVSRPADDMYGPINRYFLRLKDYHGAFQDSFTLPAFLSLYCNASDDQSRCKVERNWALLALKDGTVDEFCYKIISQSHIPELIMSSLDSSIGNPEYTGEVSLTIEVISSLIRAGGSRAATHMIQRLGILSWLNGIISWRDVSTVLPYTALKCKYLRLICIAVQTYNTNITADTPFFEKIPLSNAIIRICLAADGSGEKSDSNDTSLLECTCDALWEIHLADQKSCDNNTEFICGHTNLEDMTNLLKKFVSQKVMFSKVLSSLCNLPFAAAQEDSSASIFCKLALGYVVHHKNTKEYVPNLVVHVLKRVHELAIKYPQLVNDAIPTRLMLKCRRLAVLEDGGVQIWRQIMALLAADDS